MASTNEQIFEANVKHAVFLERLKPTEFKKLVEFLDKEVTPDLLQAIRKRLTRVEGMAFNAPQVTAQLNKLTKDIIELTSSGYDAMHRDFTVSMEDLIDAEADFAVSTLKRAIPVTLNIQRPPISVLNNIVQATPFLGANLGEWFKDTGDANIVRLDRAVKSGMVQGSSIDDIVRSVSGTRGTTGVQDISANSIRTIVRTAVNHIGDRGRLSVYERNKDILEGEQWISTLDSRTSDICISLDGRKFEVGRGVRPPVHANCRSIRVPIVKSLESMLGLKVIEPKTGTRAANAVVRSQLKGKTAKQVRAIKTKLQGQIPADTSFGTFLRKQSNAFQDETLGKGKAALFRSGDLKLSGLVSKDLKPINLAELRRRAGITPKKAKSKTPKLRKVPVKKFVPYKPVEDLDEAVAWAEKNYCKKVVFDAKSLSKKWGTPIKSKARAVKAMNDSNLGYSDLKSRYPNMKVDIDTFYNTESSFGRATLGGKTQVVKGAKLRMTPDRNFTDAYIKRVREWEKQKGGKMFASDTMKEWKRQSMRHEIGHHLTLKKHLPLLEKIDASKSWRVKNISHYAGTDNIEGIAEALVKYTNKSYKLGTLPRAWESIIENMLGIR